MKNLITILLGLIISSVAYADSFCKYEYYQGSERDLFVQEEVTSGRLCAELEVHIKAMDKSRLEHKYGHGELSLLTVQVNGTSREWDRNRIWLNASYLTNKNYVILHRGVANYMKSGDIIISLQ